MVRYEKPDNMRYIDLVRWLTKNMYADDCDDETVIKYLYTLCYMLSTKSRFFKDPEDYDEFAFYCASEIYFRIRSPKQNMLDEHGKPKLRKIENILQYIKTCLPLYRIEFQNTAYYQGNIPVDEVERKGGYISRGETYSSDANLLYDKFESSIHDSIYVDTVDVLRSLPDIITQEVHCRDKSIQRQVYVSILLTFIKYFTEAEILHNRYSKITMRKKLPFYYREVDFRDVVTLYHLPQQYEDYIVVKCRWIRNHLVQQLKEAFATEIPSRDILKTVVYSGVIETKGYQDES